MEKDDKKDKLNNLLGTFNITDTVTFPTRIGNNTATLIDNIFIDSSYCYIVEPCSNGLSDHEGLILTLDTPPLLFNNNKFIQTRVFNEKTIQEFQLQLSYEIWGKVFDSDSVNDSFNNFLNTYLQYYNANFTKHIRKRKQNFKIGSQQE